MSEQSTPAYRRAVIEEVLGEFMDGDLDYDTAANQLTEVAEMDR